LLITHVISVDWINASMKDPRINSKVFRIIQLVIGVSLILGILGVTSPNSQSADGKFKPPTISKVSIVLSVLVFIVISIIFVLSIPHGSAIPSGERILRVHIPLALAAIAVRLLYSVLCVFVHDTTFSLFHGSVVANVLMAIVEEFFVIVITLALGFKLSRIAVDVQQGDVVYLDQSGRDNGAQPLGSKSGTYTQSSNLGFEVSSSV
jgi:hypothetical protein